MRRTIAIVLPSLALLLLAAHFYRAGTLVLAGASFAMIALVFVSQAWSARVLRVVLIIGALEWLRTAWVLAAHRAAAAQPYLRMLLILGAVAAVTAIAAIVAGRLARPSDAARGDV